jgi:Tol biopolymer transport system component
LSPYIAPMCFLVKILGGDFYLHVPEGIASISDILLGEENVMFTVKIGTRWLARIALFFVIPVFIAFPAIASTDADKLVSVPTFGDVTEFEITSDGEYVVFTGDLDTDGETELYSIPLAGGTPTKLNFGSLLGIGFSLSPDGAWVVYTHDNSIYSVPVNGPNSASLKLSGDDVINSGGYAFVSPNSQRVVYLVDEPGNYYFVTAMYSVPIAGGTKTKLNKDLVAGGSIDYFYLVFSPDSQNVVYGASQDTVGINELYSVPVAGPALAGVKLNGALPEGGDVELSGYEISPDSSRVVYLADQVDGVKEIFSVPVAGPADQGVKLNGSLPDGADGVDSFRISPDSSRVVYMADQVTQGINELYTVPIQGGTAIKLNHDMEYDYIGLTDEVWLFAISPDNSTVVFEATWVNHVLDPFVMSFEVSELFTVPITGTASDEIKLWGPVDTAGYPERHVGMEGINAVNHPICDIKFNQQGDIAVYRSGYPHSLLCALWSIPVDGSEDQEQLYTEGTTGWEEVDASYEVSPDDARVVYSQEYTTTIGTTSNGLLQINGTLAEIKLTELFSVPIEGPVNESQKLNGTLVEGGNVSGWDLSPDGCQVVYRADQDTDEVYELYIADHPCTPPTPSDTPTSEQTPGIPSPTPPTPQPGDDMKLFMPLTLRD